MKPFPLAFALLLFACAPVPEQAELIPAVAVQLTTAPTAIIEPSPVPSPTVDAIQLIQAAQAESRQAVDAMNQAIMQSNLSLATANAAVSTQNSAVATANGAQVESKLADNTRIGLEITQSNQVMTIVAITQTREAAHATQTAYVPTAIVLVANANSDSDTMLLRKVVDALFWPILVVLVFILIFYTLYKWATPLPEPEEPVTPNELENAPVKPSAPVKLYERLPEGGTRRDTDPPGDPEKFRALIAHARAGEYLGVNVVVASGIYPSNDSYQPVADWLFNKRYIATNNKGGKVFSLAGKQFCSEWEQIHPCPNPESAQKQTDSRHDNDYHTEGGYQFATSAPKGPKKG
jgi:hypothetical protein